MTAIEILKALQKTPRLSPALIASETGIELQRVRNYLVMLLELKLVEKPSRGLYQITSMGNYLLGNQIECGING